MLAFQEKLEQGLLCLLVPCYELYYVFSRWEDTKGEFALQMLPAANMVVVAAVAFSIGFVGAYERATSEPAVAPAPEGNPPGPARARREASPGAAITGPRPRTGRGGLFRQTPYRSIRGRSFWWSQAFQLMTIRHGG